MIWLLCTVLTLGLTGALLLGRYTVELKWESDGKSHIFSLDALPWSGLFNIVWTGEHSCSRLHYRFLLFEFSRSPAKKMRRTEKRKKKTGKKETEKKRKKISSSLIRSSIRVLPWTLRRLIRTFHIRRGLCILELGCGDPARTGQLFGTVCALQGFLPGEFELDVKPDFSRAVFAGEAFFLIRFTVARIIGIAFASAFQLGWRSILDRHKR
jgi:hypothetical protein